MIMVDMAWGLEKVQRREKLKEVVSSREHFQLFNHNIFK